jgi:plastocyanin
MRNLLKLAFVLCSAAAFSLPSVRGETFQVQVGAGGNKYTPANITINKGDTIQWTWSGLNHSATSGTPGHPDGIFDSGILNTGATFSFTFTAAGTFPYFCTVHGGCCGMIGSVTVNDAVDTVTITRARYDTARSQLTVQATDSNETATLTVSVTSTGETLGTMQNKGGGSYSFKKGGIANPRQITVTSNFGGTATARVKAR